MKSKHAIRHFGTQAAVAAVLGLSRAAVNKWADVVPLESARALEILTGGDLKVDESLYPALLRAERITEQQAAS